MMLLMLPPSPTESMNAEVVAEIVEGVWSGEPGVGWHLRHTVPIRRALRAPEDATGVLVPVRNLERSLPALKDSALRAESVAILIEDDLAPGSTRFGALRVRSITEALDALALHRRQRYDGKVIAVTGSVGKTTVKGMIGTALSQVAQTYWRPDNQNGVSAVRRQCFDLDQQAYAVIEIARIGLPAGALVARPDVAIVTGVAEAHMQDMGSLDEIARFKAQIFEGLTPGGTAVVNRDAPYSHLLIDLAKGHAHYVLTYGADVDADVRLEDYDPNTGQVSASAFGSMWRYRIGARGYHNALNSLAVLCAAKALEVDVRRVLDSLKSFHLTSGRGGSSRVSIGGRQITLVDQSYNANPASMRAALADFATQDAEGRRVLVLGDMRELGPTEAQLHADLLEPVIACAPDRVYLVGHQMRHLWTLLPDELRAAHVTSTAQLQAVLASDLRDGDAVLMKASRDTGLHHFARSLTDELTDERPESWRVTITGPTVQGVGYRQWLKKLALQHNLDGWVRNRTDGKVEALLRGRKADLQTVSSQMHTGPSNSDVSQVLTRRTTTVPRPGFRQRQTRTI